MTLAEMKTSGHFVLQERKRVNKELLLLIMFSRLVGVILEVPAKMLIILLHIILVFLTSMSKALGTNLATGTKRFV